MVSRERVLGVIIRPLIWTPDLSSPQPVEQLVTALESVRLFYAAYNYPLTVLPSAVEPMPAIDLSRDDIWPQVWQPLQSRFRDGESILVVLDDDVGDEYTWGWGGYPLAVLRGSSMRRLRTLWTPGNRWVDALAVVDDYQVAGAAAHEVGHCLGFQHDFDSPSNIMGPWWVQFKTGTCVPSKAMVDAQRGTEVARLAVAAQWLEGCRLETI